MRRLALSVVLMAVLSPVAICGEIETPGHTRVRVPTINIVLTYLSIVLR